MYLKRVMASAGWLVARHGLLVVRTIDYLDPAGNPLGKVKRDVLSPSRCPSNDYCRYSVFSIGLNTLLISCKDNTQA